MLFFCGSKTKFVFEWKIVRVVCLVVLVWVFGRAWCELTWHFLESFILFRLCKCSVADKFSTIMHQASLSLTLISHFDQWFFIGLLLLMFSYDQIISNQYVTRITLGVLMHLLLFNFEACYIYVSIGHSRMLILSFCFRSWTWSIKICTRDALDACIGD